MQTKLETLRRMMEKLLRANNPEQALIEMGLSDRQASTVAGSKGFVAAGALVAKD